MKIEGMTCKSAMWYSSNVAVDHKPSRKLSLGEKGLFLMNSDDTIREYRWTERAWYADVADHPAVSLMISEGHYHGEILCEWIPLGSRMVPRLTVYNDAWYALALVPDLVAELAKIGSEYISTSHFVAMLDRLGFVDCTEYGESMQCPRCGYSSWSEVGQRGH